MSTYTDEQLQQLIPFMEKLAEYNCGYDLSKALMVEMLHLRDLLREVCEVAEVRHSNGWRLCNICLGVRRGSEEFHLSDCPVGTAKKFLGIDQ